MWSAHPDRGPDFLSLVNESSNHSPNHQSAYGHHRTNWEDQGKIRGREDQGTGWILTSDKQIRAELRADMRRTIVAEQEAPMEDVIAAYREAKKSEPLLLRMDRRVRYWTDGAVIGSREFVQRVSDSYFGADKRSRFTKGQVSDGGALYMLRSLRE